MLCLFCCSQTCMLEKATTKEEHYHNPFMYTTLGEICAHLCVGWLVVYDRALTVTQHS